MLSTLSTVDVRVPSEPTVGAGRTFQVNGNDVTATPSESVIVTVTFEDVPGVVGVPVMVPVVALMLNPAGAPASVKLHGPLGHVETTAKLTGCPCVDVCALGLVTVGAATTVQVKVVEPVRPNASMTST